MAADRGPEPAMRSVAVIALTVLAALSVPQIGGTSDRAGGALPVPMAEEKAPRILRASSPLPPGPAGPPMPVLAQPAPWPEVQGRIAEGALFRF